MLSAQVNQGRPIARRLSRRQTRAWLRRAQTFPEGTTIRFSHPHWIVTNRYGYFAAPPPVVADLTGDVTPNPGQLDNERWTSRRLASCWRHRSVNLIPRDSGGSMWVEAIDLLGEHVDVCLPTTLWDEWVIAQEVEVEAAAPPPPPPPPPSPYYGGSIPWITMTPEPREVALPVPVQEEEEAAPPPVRWNPPVFRTRWQR